jgi:hypothetical protein
MKLKPGMVFEYVSVPTKKKNNESELLIIINITPLPLQTFKMEGGVLRDRKRLIVYKVEDSQLHTISSYTLLKYYNLLYTADRKEQRGEKKLKI